MVTALLRSTDNRSSLQMRCKDRKIEIAVTKWGFVKCGVGVRVIYRINQDQAVDVPWVSHSSCVLAISPSPIPFIQSLTDEGKVYFRLFDHHDNALGTPAPTPAATPKRDLVSVPTDPKTEPALPRASTEPVKLERPPLRPGRVRRDDDGPRVREAATERRARYPTAPIWHRNGGGIGVILGVGF